MQSSSCDLLIHPGWVLSMAGSDDDPMEVLTAHSVAVNEGRIVAVGPTETLKSEYDASEEVAAADSILTPGLINAHTHAAMSLLRGAGEDLPLERWLLERIWPLERQLVNADYVTTGSELAMAEMLLTGTTTFADMYFFPEATAAAAKSAGMRAQLAFPVFDGANAWSQSIDDCFHQGLALHDNYRNDPLVSIAFGPHAAYSVTRDALEKILMFSDELGLMVHIHLHETSQEVRDAERENGRSWVSALHEIGLLNPQLQAVHMTQLTQREIEMVAENGVHVAHCPNSNLKLASGICPTTALKQAGINVALGSDGAASNNNLDLLEEARLASLLAKYQTNDPATGDIHSTLRMATINGARALGRGDELGSIEVGKYADLAMFQGDAITTLPRYDVAGDLLHNSPAYKAQHVWVAGKQVVEDGNLTTIDTSRLRANVAQESQRVREIIDA